MLKNLRRRFGIHPRAWLHAALTYPRFIGRIKPKLLAGSEQEVVARLAATAGATEPAHLAPPLGKRLLAFSPHPDDETIGAGGLLLAHRGQAELAIVTLFNGEAGGQLGSQPWSQDAGYRAALVEARRAELAGVAGILGATAVHAINLPDGYASPDRKDVERIRAIVEPLRPDVVLIPWFLDNLPDHRMANLLYASACGHLDCMVLAYEVWSLCSPNAYFDFTNLFQEKLELVRRYQTQTATIDYERLVKGLSMSRGFQLAPASRQTSAAEAFLAMPNADYCDIVRALYGDPDSPTEFSRRSFPGLR